jgi:heparanase 1
MPNPIAARICCGIASALLLAAPVYSGTIADAPSVAPSSMPRVGTVDARFQSYNIEMVELTGGRFWKPYRSKHDVQGAPALHPGSDAPPRMDSNLYEYRPPIDLTDTRLRKLAAALAPAYVRVSGTWANTTYFADSESPPSVPPAGFNGILTRQQWRSLIDFSHAVDARIVTSFSAGPGSRDAGGVWKPDQARRLLAYTRSVEGSIAAAEFTNEPDLAAVSGLPAGYDASAYGRDFGIFRRFMMQSSPELMILGPGTAGETTVASSLLAASTPDLDALSYHYYAALSARCGGKLTAETALSERWLSGTDRVLNFYRALRDEFEPGRPIWLTETADAACGGNPSAATFLDTFRYLDQLGRLAKAGVQVVMHNTLAGSDYGLLDEQTRQPRPNYWGALLWRQLMGTTVLDAGSPVQSGLHVYAHCQREVAGGVTLLVINTSRNAPRSLTLPTASERYTLDAVSLADIDVRLNGRALKLSAHDELPSTAGVPTIAGTTTFAPATITFLAIPAAANDACR